MRSPRKSEGNENPKTISGPFQYLDVDQTRKNQYEKDPSVKWEVESRGRARECGILEAIRRPFQNR